MIDKHEVLSSHWIAIILIYITIIAVSLSVGTLLLVNDVDNNTDRITALEKSDIRQVHSENRVQDLALIAQRQAIYRICVRQQVTRAVLVVDKDHDEPILPLYDCAPNLIGQKAKRLTLKQTKAFVHWVEATPASHLP